MKGLLKTKPAINQFLVLFGVTLVSLFLIGAIASVIMIPISGIKLSEIKDVLKTDFSKPGVLTYFRGLQVIQFLALFIIPVFICAHLFSENKKEYLGLKIPSNTAYYVAGIAILLLAIPLAGWLGEINKNISFPSSWASWMKKSEEQAAHVQTGLLSRHTIPDLLINIVLIAGTAGVGEELLFRGMAQRLLTKMFKSPWAGILIAAFLFSAMHMQFYGFLPRFLLGILLGAAYWYSGSLWVSMLAHFVYDAVVLIMMYNASALVDEKATPLTGQTLLVAGLASGAVVGAILFWMKKKSTVTYQQVYADDAIPVKNHPFDFERKLPE
jgi:uncharacterized protein